jgi:mannose-6-phosphate isomerase-like protein (cupin superfamily)
MSRADWDQLLEIARATHQANAALTAFCPFPDDVTPQDVTPHHIPAADLMSEDTVLTEPLHADLRAGFVTCGPHAMWRETYKGTDIGDRFLDNFACYCLIGEGGAYHSDRMWAWVVYMSSHLHYPWHHHPGEEMYLVLGGSGQFLREGKPPLHLYAGDTLQHHSNEPHALDTLDDPLMCYVVWRNGFGVKPVLTGSAG